MGSELCPVAGLACSALQGEGKDEYSKHDSFEQNECGYSLLIHKEFLLSRSGSFTATLTSQVGWYFLLEQQCSRPVLNSAGELL